MKIRTRATRDLVLLIAIVPLIGVAGCTKSTATTTERVDAGGGNAVQSHSTPAASASDSAGPPDFAARDAGAWKGVKIKLDCTGDGACVEVGHDLRVTATALSPTQQAALAQKTSDRCDAELSRGLDGNHYDPEPCVNHAILLLNGRGVGKDEHAANRRLYVTCQVDETALDACAGWGALEAAGIGSAQDVPKALAILDRACRKGESDACEDRDAILKAEKK